MPLVYRLHNEREIRRVVKVVLIPGLIATVGQVSADLLRFTRIALRFPHQRRRALDTHKGACLLEDLRHVLTAMIMPQHSATGPAFPQGPNAGRPPCRSGSSASTRGPDVAAWPPTHSAAQCSTAMNIAPGPASRVTVVVLSGPPSVSTRSVVRVPSGAFGPGGRPGRCGAHRPGARIRRKTRRGDVRPPATRRRAHTLRSPSPWQGAVCQTVRLCSTQASSGQGSCGPGRVPLPVRACRCP